MVREITTTTVRTIELVPAKAGEGQESHVLTVRNYAPYGQESRPQINIVGRWLEKAGFEPGDKVQVSVEENRLVVEKLEPSAGS